METPNWLGIIFSLFGIVVLYFGFINKQDQRTTALETWKVGADDKFKKCDACIASTVSYNVKMELMWKALEPALLKVIHSPTHLRRDALIDRLAAEEPLNKAELEELDGELSRGLSETKEPGKLLSFALFRARVSHKLYDLQEKKEHAIADTCH